jgi:hypothetical protein
MSAPYIPNKDAALDTFATNFSALITAAPATYGLVAGDATTIAGVRLTFHTAYLAATNGATRGPSTITVKDAAKVNMLATIRPYAQQIANNGGVTNGNKIALGLNPRTSTPTPFPTPATAPVLLLAAGMPMQHQLRYRDATAIPSVKAKPAGAIQLILSGATSPTVISNPALLPFLSAQTKSPFIQQWGSGDVGKIAYYAARWITRTGLMGPYSAILSATIM